MPNRLPPVVADRILALLDARSIAALRCSGHAYSRGDPEAPLSLLTRIPIFARLRVSSALGLLSSESASCFGAASADDELFMLPFSRGGLCSWIEALDEIESWSRMRASVESVTNDSIDGSSKLPVDAVLLQNMRSLRHKEDLVAHTFPGRSL